MLAGWSKASDLERPGLATSQEPSDVSVGGLVLGDFN
jgi:hypothetical protein